MPRPRGPNDGPDGKPVPSRRKPKRERGGRLIPRDPNRDVAVKNLFSALDQDAFIEACSASSDIRFSAFAAGAAAPRWRNWSLPRLAREMGITLTELYEFWRDNQHVVGMIHMMNTIPDVYRTTGEDAISRDYTCPDCGGTGKIAIHDGKTGEKDAPPVPMLIPCRTCHGTAKIRVPANEKARDLVFETTGLTGKRSGMAVIGQLNIGKDESLESMIATAQKVISPPRRIIDVTPKEDAQ